MSGLDAARLRADFPILAREVNGHPLVYLDNAATTQKPRAVIDALTRYYETQNANIHRGIHALAVEATEAYEEARGKAAWHIGARPADVVFTRNATESINLVARAWGDARVGEGDEIALTIMEHHSNIVPWQQLAGRTGARLRYAGIDAEGRLDLDSLRALIGPRTKLVAVTHMSNVLGSITPVAEVAEMARAAGAMLLVDGAQSAPHLPVDAAALGCDFFAFSAHKMLGPTGVGALWARPGLLDEMDPFLGGGEMIALVREDESTWAAPPNRFEAGTPNIAGVIAFGAALDYLRGAGMEAIHAHERALTARAIEALSRTGGVTLHGPRDTEARGGVVSFTVEGAHPHDVSTIVDARGVAIRAGHHCAQPLMRHLGAAATNRASFALYNEEREIDVLVEALDEVKRIFGRVESRTAV